jgi:ApbE superfamily uncharacterized protein (UPF0280 family)
MLMSILAFKAGSPSITLANQGAKKAVEVFKILASFWKVITQNINKIVLVDSFPPVVKKMILAARKFEDPTVTPLIGVAGVTADEVADFIYNTGEVSKVVVNNGGDIAIRLKEQEAVRVGIKTDLNGKGISHIVNITAESGIRGIATSGFGGRSFTRGIANAAVAIANDSVSADVAATLIGNATEIGSPRVVRTLAKNLSPNTDIPDLLVTKSIGHLERSEIELALEQGIQKAETLKDKGLIIGAFIAVRDRYKISDSIATLIQPVSDLIAV